MQTIKIDVEPVCLLFDSDFFQGGLRVEYKKQGQRHIQQMKSDAAACSSALFTLRQVDLVGFAD